MNSAENKPIEQDPRVYFAAERTFLAWIRTGLALMGIGFAVSRFGLFLRQITAADSHLPANPHTTGLSLWSGVALVAIGVIVTVNDRGPFVRGRVLDLSTGAARAIGLTSAGVGRVTAEVL